MRPEYPIRETVTTIVITKQLQKITFQIKHPENASHILSIGITCDLVPDESSGGGTGGSTGGEGTGGGSTGGSSGGGTINTSSLAGYINIAAPQKGDVIFSSDVRLDNNDFSDLFEKAINGNSVSVSDRKKFNAHFDTCLRVNNTSFEGFYEDVYSPSLLDSHGATKPFLYKVRVYMRYLVSNEQNEQNKQKTQGHDC